ncbi:MAG: nucleoid-associated protein EbfC [Desulfonauticus sp.]|nr:MAG: Nucleoid-associated protein [Desulfonauticus sp. 38_4375]MDK2920798.1 nucleoid-associated protein EbfC [Desulfonauticus sp.]
MNDLIRQAQMLQKKMLQMQEELKNKVVEASAGGGMVQVKVSGGQEVLEIKIDPTVVDPNDVQMLEDLVLAAVNDGLKKAKEMVQSEMSQLTGGLNIPGLF